MTVTTLRVMRALGAGMGVLQASPMGATVYRRLGFDADPRWLCFEEATHGDDGESSGPT